jgi:glucose-1-phosphate thymidylyltransferase
MKGIILAGGTGSRLFPLTRVTNKHLLPVGREPMIYHPVRKLIEAGIEDILIVTGVEHMGDVVNALGSGVDFDCRFTYRVQDQAGGIAQALKLAEGFAGTDSMLVILGDNIFEANLSSVCTFFENSDAEALLMLKSVPDPGRYGVAEVQGDAILSIEEKPEDPKSDLAVTGLYFYKPVVFDLIDLIKPSGRGELEITDVNNHLIHRKKLMWKPLNGWWTDAGTFESLAAANQLVEGIQS